MHPIQFTIREGLAQMDMPAVQTMLETAYWWAKTPETARDDILKAAEHSALVVGAFDETGRQIGYARVVSDYCRFAYIADVFVKEAHRGQGVGKAMIRRIQQHADFGPGCRFLLVTRDAHDFYSALGFQVMGRPGDHLEWFRSPKEDK